MRLNSLMLFVVIALSACASNDLSKEDAIQETTFNSREKMLISSGNQRKIIEFYKQELSERESEDVRVKLVEAYIQFGDYESAEFHIATIPVTDDNAAKVTYLKAKLFLAKGDVEAAYLRNTTALSMQDSYPEAENLMGLILAEKGEFEDARQYFYSAKKHFYSDLTVNNNLAVIDLIEGKYQNVVTRLEPIYQRNEADKKVKSNLVLAYAKLGRFEQAEPILKGFGFKSDQIQEIFLTLRSASSVMGQDDSYSRLKPKVDRTTSNKIKIITEAPIEESNEANVAEVANANEATEVVSVNEIAEVDSVNEVTEVASVNEATEVASVNEVTEATSVNEVKEVDSINKTSDADSVTEGVGINNE